MDLLASPSYAQLLNKLAEPAILKKTTELKLNPYTLHYAPVFVGVVLKLAMV